MKENTENDAFDTEWEQTGRAAIMTERGRSNTRFIPEIGVVHERIAILHEPSWSVESNRGWGDSVAVNIVDLETGERMVWWFSAQSPSGRNSIFHDRLKSMLEASFLEGHNYPIEFKFKIVENLSQKTGNTYKELRPIFVAAGDQVKGNMGVDSRDDPRNDESIPSKDTVKPTSKPKYDEATKTQWDSLTRALGDIFGEYTATDVITWFSEKGIEVSSEELIGSPDGKGLPRIGFGNLDSEKATQMIALLTIETHEKE
jgi:hypothetical protein